MTLEKATIVMSNTNNVKTMSAAKAAMEASGRLADMIQAAWPVYASGRADEEERDRVIRDVIAAFEEMDAAMEDNVWWPGVSSTHCLPMANFYRRLERRRNGEHVYDPKVHEARLEIAKRLDKRGIRGGVVPVIVP